MAAHQEYPPPPPEVPPTPPAKATRGEVAADVVALALMVIGLILNNRAGAALIGASAVLILTVIGRQAVTGRFPATYRRYHRS